MSIQFNPQSATPSIADATGQHPAPPAAPAMAPVSLTPLAPPASAGPVPAGPGAGQDGVNQGRQAAFAERQQALLERLRQRAAAPAAQSGGLSEAQRSACLSVLAAVASAAAR